MMRLAAKFSVAILTLFFVMGASQSLTAQQVYQKVKHSVFTLYSYNFDTRKVKGRGSAVAIGKDILATNCHVALAGNYLTVKVGKKSRVARLFYKNEKQDLCLLEVPKASFSPVKIRGSEGVKIGEVVYAIGNPRGTEKTLSKGIISNKHKVNGGTWLQTDAAIYYGSSGGGLFDEEGRLIGITSKMGGNFGFAIPTEWILQVIHPGKYPRKVAADTKKPQSTEPGDYSHAHANLTLLGTYGKIKLFRNNKECFLSVPGYDQKANLSSISLWNPRIPKSLVVFSHAVSTKQALEHVYKSILDRKTLQQTSFRSKNILRLAGDAYQLYGARTDRGQYQFYVARLHERPADIFKKAGKFTVQFKHAGGDLVSYSLGGFSDALSAYYQHCRKIDNK